MSSLTTKILAGIFLCVVFGVSAYTVVISQKKAPVEPVKIAVVPKNVLEKKIIGHSVENRAIESITFGHGPKHILFVGGIHGGYEWNSVLLAYQVIDDFTAHPEKIPSNLTVTVIPNSNPDGVFTIVGKEGRFVSEDVPKTDAASGRFNANGVDLNRNFDCKWSEKGVWKGKSVSTGSGAFSEPESRALRDYIATFNPDAVVFWHSQANAVYASQCEKGILPGTLAIMNSYAKAAGYQAVETFDAYVVTGAAEDWLASIGVPAITVELSSHESTEWNKNSAGIAALLKYFSN